jgi:hypothetical protein
MSKHDAETLGTNYHNSGLRYFNDFHSAHRRQPTRHDLAGDRFTVTDLFKALHAESVIPEESARMRALRTALFDAQFQAARNRHPAGKGLIAA